MIKEVKVREANAVGFTSNFDDYDTRKIKIADYTFIDWTLTKEMWNKLSWFDKLRAILLFKIILPKSRLHIK